MPRWSALAAVMLLAACSGGAAPVTPSTDSAAARGAASASPAHERARARFEIRIPRHRRHARYVSPNTASMTVTVNGKNDGIYALNASSNHCATAGGSLQCSFTVVIPSGNDTIAVSTFASSDGSGTALSTGAVTQKVAGGKLSVIPLTLAGVVSSIGVTLGNASPPAGTAVTVPVYVTGFDASGAMIVGPGNFATPVTLSNSDKSGITNLSATTAAGPGTPISLSYSGASIVSATIGAAAGAVSTTGATFAPAPAVFASFDAPPSLGTGGQPRAIAPGPDGNVWYTWSTQRTPARGAVVRLTPAGVSTTYVGGVTPNLVSGNYAGIALGPDRNLWVTDPTNDAIYSINAATGAVISYPSPGSTCPNRIIAGPAGDGGLWFTSHCGSGSGLIGHITTSGTATSFALAGASRNMQGLVLGKDGNLYVADQGNNAIAQVQIAGGAVTGFSEVTIPNNPIDGFANSNLLGVAQTADGQLWFTNDGCNPDTLGSVTIATTFSSSKVHEFGPVQACANPAFMAPAFGGAALFLGINDGPIVEQVVPNGIGAAPLLTDYEFQTPTTNGIYQASYDVTIGPNGNVWATNFSTGYLTGGNILEMAY